MSTSQNRPCRIAVYCRLSKKEIEPASDVSIGDKISLLTDCNENHDWSIREAYIQKEYCAGSLKHPDFQRIRLPENLRHRQSTVRGKDGGNG